MQQSLQDYFTWLVPLWIVLCAAALIWNCYLYKRHSMAFPQIPHQAIRFDESGASGCSHKTLLTKFGGANRCLRVTVTDTEVWIRTGFPFSIFAWRLDLEHRIPKGSISSVQQSRTGFRRSLLLDYRDERGQEHRLSLLLRKPDDFFKSLGLQTGTV